MTTISMSHFKISSNDLLDSKEALIKEPSNKSKGISSDSVSSSFSSSQSPSQASKSLRLEFETSGSMFEELLLDFSSRIFSCVSERSWRNEDKN